MEKQYYTPKIEHFHVGFRYEHFEDWDVPNKEKEWHKQVYGKNGTNWEQMDYVDDSTIANGRIRVKSLDHDDIIEAGWVKKGRFYSLEVIEFEQGVSPLDCFGISKGDLWCYIAKVGSKYLIFNEANDVLFKGKIANYNKLLDVMEMLEIGNNK